MEADEFEGEEREGAEEEEVMEELDGEGTLVSIGKGADEEEVEDLINVMQNALDKSETGLKINIFLAILRRVYRNFIAIRVLHGFLVKSQTLQDEEKTDAFGPTVRDVKIKNLKAEACRKLGVEAFELAYDYLKEARFGSDLKDEYEIMTGLARICKQPNDCFLVDQLLFLEAQSQLS